MATQQKTWERWSDEEVSALLAIYSEGFSRSCWESQQLLLPVPNSGDLRPGTSGGSIRREVVCGLPVNPKQKKKKKKWRQRLPQGLIPVWTQFTRWFQEIKVPGKSSGNYSWEKYLVWKRLIGLFCIISPCVLVAGNRQVLWMDNYALCQEFGKRVLPAHLHSPPALPRPATPLPRPATLLPLIGQGRRGVVG